MKTNTIITIEEDKIRFYDMDNGTTASARTGNIWYAVQQDDEDAWDNGSEDYKDALKIAEEESAMQIAVIDTSDGVTECIAMIRISYDD